MTKGFRSDFDHYYASHLDFSIVSADSVLTPREYDTGNSSVSLGQDGGSESNTGSGSGFVTQVTKTIEQYLVKGPSGKKRISKEKK
jgi:hypothetical protein